ncbi:hypothetical protein WA026_022458 [Henosepilachna vigintioctopunctata]|uniref:Uncharacterized protein n=1 Tax=Henosepilachna vigintioctopunctata TaxID=420089 RepID=A0AAW1TYV5_9CUCU
MYKYLGQNYLSQVKIDAEYKTKRKQLKQIQEMKKQLLNQQKMQLYQRETYKSQNSSGVNVNLNNEQVISNIPTSNRFGALNEVSEEEMDHSHPK